MWILHIVALPVSARQPHLVGGMDGYLTYGVRHPLPATRALSRCLERRPLVHASMRQGAGGKRLNHLHLWSEEGPQRALQLSVSRRDAGWP